jgi:antitoxin ParD1/3/4
MATSVYLGEHFESFAARMVQSGRYNNTSELVREGLRIIEERERRLASLDATLERSRADMQAGRVKPAEEVFDRLEAKYLRMAEGNGNL